VEDDIMSLQNRTQRIAADQKMITGIQEHLASLTAITVAGQSMAPADIVKLYQARVASGQAVIAAETAKLGASQADVSEVKQTAAFASAFRKMVQAMYANNPTILADFGLKPPAVSKPTAATKVAAVAKRKATRAARHTMGPKQKAAIHGTAPESPPAAGSTSSTPAPAAASTATTAATKS
jgi:hypothetical protein